MNLTEKHQPTAAEIGRLGGSVKSKAKSDAAKLRNAKRKLEGKPEGGRQKKTQNE